MTVVLAVIRKLGRNGTLRDGLRSVYEYHPQGAMARQISSLHVILHESLTVYARLPKTLRYAVIAY